MKFKDMIIKNRSVRGYDRTRLVTQEEMLEMLDCARLSASSMSVQPLKFYMTKSIEEADLITANVKYAGALPELGLPLKGTEPPAYILVCHDLRIFPSEKRFLKDVGIVAQSMSLAATEMGLNCLMMGAYNPQTVRELVGLPDYYVVMLVLAVGKSAEDIRLEEVETPAAPVDEAVLAEKYNGSFAEYSEANEELLKKYRAEDLAKVQYYREDGVHYAPKRRLEDMLIKKARG